MTTKSSSILKSIPNTVDTNEVHSYLNEQKITYIYLNAFKDFSNLNDIEISLILDLSVKTFRKYRSLKEELSERLKEHTVALFALFKHGIEVFGSEAEFKDWLREENFYFDNEAPESNLKTYSGIKFIDDRLTAMEYGDNV